MSRCEECDSKDDLITCHSVDGDIGLCDECALQEGYCVKCGQFALSNCCYQQNGRVCGDCVEVEVLTGI